MEIFGDFDTSVKKALSEIDTNWKSYPGLIICGTHDPHKWDIEGLIEKITQARNSGTPFYGECWGHQLAAIEYARTILKIKDATSEEFKKQGTYVVKKRQGLQVGFILGESYWNNYEVAISWEKPKNFFTSQAHPSYQSSKNKPHPLLVDFLDYARKMAM